MANDPSTGSGGGAPLPAWYSDPLAPTTARYVIRQYPQANANGTVQEVTAWSDGTYTTKGVAPQQSGQPMALKLDAGRILLLVGLLIVGSILKGR